MTNLIVLASALAAIAPAQANVPAKPVPAPSGTIIVKFLPSVESNVDPNYIIDAPTKMDGKVNEQNNYKQDVSTADSRLEEMKKVLNERFKKMFELKASLDKTQCALSAKWEEYYSMNQAYNKELKKIIADWVTDNNYNG